jgi:hypothetical protein
MRARRVTISRLAWYMSFAVVGFLSVAYGRSLAAGSRVGALAEHEMAVTYGAQCTNTGGIDCAQNNPQCQQTGCKGGNTCKLDADNVHCYKVGAGGNNVTDCSTTQNLGNCCASCGSGCSTYWAGFAFMVGGNLTCVGSTCSEQYNCGTSNCTVYNCQ